MLGEPLMKLKSLVVRQHSTLGKARTRMVFISYRWADSESVVGRIDSHLKKHFPTLDVFLDHDRIPLR